MFYFPAKKQVDKALSKEVQAASTHKDPDQDAKHGSHKHTRTFGNLKDESPLKNGDAFEEDSTDKTNDNMTEEHSKFSREMKMLGHDDLKSPKSIRRKFKFFIFQVGTTLYI